MSQGVYEAIVLESFPISDYSSSRKSAMPRCLKILANALSCHVALRQQALNWSLDVSRLFVVTPRGLTDLSDFRVISVQFQFNVIYAYGDKILSWNLFGLTFMPFLFSSNQSVAILQSNHFVRLLSNNTLNCHRHNCTAYNFQQTRISHL